MNPHEPSPDEPPYWIDDAIDLGTVDAIDPVDLERPPSQQLGVYAEQKRQAVGAFNICCLFAVVGAVQALAGIISVFWNHVSPVGSSALLGAGGVFGALSNWAFKLSDNANTRLERIAGDEKARELIDSISLPSKRDEEISKFLKILAGRSK